jgi:transposase
MAYSKDFRCEVLSIRERAGLTTAEVADRFDVGVASVVRWLKTVERKAAGPRKRKLDMEAWRAMWRRIRMRTGMSGRNALG